MVVVELRAGAFEIPVVIEQLETAQKRGRRAIEQNGNLVGTKKTVLMHHVDDLTVAQSQHQGWQIGKPFEPRQALRFHPIRLPKKPDSAETGGFVRSGNITLRLAA